MHPQRNLRDFTKIYLVDTPKIERILSVHNCSCYQVTFETHSLFNYVSFYLQQMMPNQVLKSKIWVRMVSGQTLQCAHFTTRLLGGPQEFSYV